MPRIVVKNNGVSQQRRGVIKVPTLDTDGYLQISLSRDGKTIKKRLHKVVAEAFVDGYFEGAEINHIDFDRLNNAASNLEWVSHRDNVQYSYQSGRHDDRLGKQVGSGNTNFGNHRLHDRYKADPELSKEKQARPGAMNGKAQAVRMYLQDGTYLDFAYLQACAQYLIDNSIARGKRADSVATYISRAARSQTTYRGLQFDLI